jgi:hypothetical protein
MELLARSRGQRMRLFEVFNGIQERVTPTVVTTRMISPVWATPGA